MTRRLVLILSVLVMLSASACNPEEYFIRVAFTERGANDAQVQQAVRVARCESGLRHWAISPGGGNWGTFQINTVHRQRVANMGYRWDHMLLPLENARVAAAIWSEQGWRPWTCRKLL